MLSASPTARIVHLPENAEQRPTSRRMWGALLVQGGSQASLPSGTAGAAGSAARNGKNLFRNSST